MTAQEISSLVSRYYRDDPAVDDELSIKGQQWYRGCRELLARHDSSALSEFDECYASSSRDSYFDLEPVLSAKSRRAIGMSLEQFQQGFRKARSLVRALVDELQSRELPVVTQLSLSIASDELETAELLLRENGSNDVMVRASGVIARIALERHLWTVANDRGVAVVKNPPHKRNADVQDLLTALVNASVITGVQRSHFESLFSVGNNCAHPKEPVQIADVRRLIADGKSLSQTVV
jgi:hypothetical protein